MQPEAQAEHNPTRIRVVGTAGHVDHGKSSLIEALTGTHPDRLKEEQERQMTIDLGFGWLTLPDGREIGIVDVPGHRDFIANMLAGVAAIDAVILVVASDEGVQPQTTEHLAIIDLLGISGGVIALTKADLVQDDAWWRLLEADVRAVVAGTALQNAPLVRVSARTRFGLTELTRELSAQLEGQVPRPDLGRPRLNIDRVFTMEGFGTVVTGTLLDGELALGDDVEVLPSGLRGRIRSLQNHRRPIQRALPGTRTAVNISGLQAGQLKRGDVLARPGQYSSTRRVDASLRLLAGSSIPLTHNTEVKVFLGTGESIAAVRLLGADELAPAQSGLVQLELHESIVCARGDAFILRRPSPPETLGGGSIVDPHPAGRHRRFDAGVIRSLEARGAGDAANILYEAAAAGGPSSLADVVARSRLAPEAARAALDELAQTRRVVLLARDTKTSSKDRFLLVDREWERLSLTIDQLTVNYHSRFPLRAGIPREELKSQLGLESQAFAAVLAEKVATGTLEDRGRALSVPGHEVRFGPLEQKQIDALLERFKASPYSPPSIKECKDAIGEDAFSAMRDLGQLVVVSDEVAFRSTDYETMLRAIRTALGRQERITLGEVRDLLGTSRKYSQAFLEHLDSIGVTKRDGDFRVLVR